MSGDADRQLADGTPVEVKTAPSTLWLVDRSRVVDGRGWCMRARALGYHLGANGYGIALKATRIPLMTGILGHEGLAPILEWCRDNDAAIQQAQQVQLADGETFLPVPHGVVREAVKRAHAKYWEVVKLRGFAYLEESEEVQSIAREQQALVEGLIWAWCLEVLPEILQRGRILEVEVDDVYVLGCTCGLGDGVLTKAEHEGRGCAGIGLMCRPDFLVETRSTGELEYHEFKTTSVDSITFRDKWEVMIQMFAATLDAERRHQKHVQVIYIHGLIKGRRSGAYNPQTKKYDLGGPTQQSIFCYGWRKPANPPMEEEEWAADYEYVGEDGKNHRLGKNWVKTGIWELPDAVLEPGMSKAEYWAKWIDSRTRRKNLIVLGPFSRQSQMVEHFTQELIGEEQRMQEGLWQLYELGQQILAETMDGDPSPWWTYVWPDPRFQQALDRHFPRSYECRRYGMRNRCQFEDICLVREGWQDPMGSGRFIERRPHHSDELQQAIDRGLLLAEAGLEEEIEQEW